MKRKIFLHGKLRNLAPDGLEFDAATVEEAISALCLQTKAFDPLPGQDRHQIEVLGFDTDESLITPLSDDVTELHLVPSMRGGKNAMGIVQIIVGVVLIAVAVASQFVAPGSFFAMSGLSAGMMGVSGAMMAAGGIMQLISPAPKQDSTDPDASKYIGAPGNTTKIGTRIPILYGRRKIFGQILSLDIEAKDVPLSWNAPTDTILTNYYEYRGGEVGSTSTPPPVVPVSPTDPVDTTTWPTDDQITAVRPDLAWTYDQNPAGLSFDEWLSVWYMSFQDTDSGILAYKASLTDPDLSDLPGYLNYLVSTTITGVPYLLTAPNGLYGSSNNSACYIGWSVVAGATGYFIYRDGVKISTVISPWPSVVYGDGGLTPGVSYTYNVTSVGSSGNEGPQSETLTVICVAAP